MVGLSFVHGSNRIYFPIGMYSERYINFFYRQLTADLNDTADGLEEQHSQFQMFFKLRALGFGREQWDVGRLRRRVDQEQYLGWCFTSGTVCKWNVIPLVLVYSGFSPGLDCGFYVWNNRCSNWEGP